MSARTLAALVAGLSASACTSRGADLASQTSPSDGAERAQRDWWAGARAWIEADQRRARILDDGGASLAARGLRVVFDERSATARSSGKAWAFRLEEVRRERGSVVRAEPAAPETDGARVIYRRGRGLVEWYENLGDAIEQGFDVEHVPGEGDLLVIGRVTTSATAVPALDGVRYGPLWVGGARADDASGRPLPAKLEARGDTLAVRVAVQDAVWPIAIDPVLRASAVWEYSNPATLDYGDPFNLGASVAAAGDVNGDGYGDVIVGVPGFESNDQSADIGRAYIFLGSSRGLATTPAWQRSEGGVGGANFGAAVAGAGDLNCDGFSDVVVGAPLLSVAGRFKAGRAFVYVGGPTVSTSPSELQGDEQTEAHFGASVAGVGDVDGNGCSDVLVGAPDHDEGGSIDSGRAYLFLGRSSLGETVTPNWQGPDPSEARPGAHFGAAVAGAGDVDGNGFADVLIGAPGFDDGPQMGSGRAFLFFGDGVGGLEASPGWTAPDPAEVQSGARFGAALGSGDVNGDGFSDVIVGAPEWDEGASDTGRVFLFLGGASGPSLLSDRDLTPDAEAGARLGAALAGAGDVNGDGLADVVVGVPDQSDTGTRVGGAYLLLGDAEATVLLRVENVPHDVQDGASLGAAVAGAGDVDGDGFGEIIVGAPGWDAPDVDAGRAFVFYGGPAGLSSTPQWTASLVPPQNQCSFGRSVANAGDVNGDGYPDVLVGAPHYDLAEVNAGRAFLFFGGNDGLTTVPGWSMTDEEEGNAEFGASVAGLGDVDGDGFSDVIIGAPKQDGAFQDTGKVFVFHGSDTGLETVPGWSLAAPQPEPEGLFGASVAGAGDVNGDGFGDALVGAPGESSSPTSPGNAYVFYGGPSGLADPPTPFSCATARTCIESPERQIGAEFGAVVAGAGDLNGDGYSDVVVTAPSYDLSPSEADHGRAYVYYGSAPGLSSSAGWRATPEPQAGARFGLSVAGAGDANGDGYSDLVVGAPNFDVPGLGLADQGRLFFFSGGLLGIPEEASFAITVDPLRDRHRFGYAVSTAGDVGGDGRADVVVGTLETAYVFSGTAGGLSALPVWSYQGAVGFGQALAAGDFDGDGFSDVAVGSSQESSSQGRAFVFSGNEEGGHGREYPPGRVLGQFDDSSTAIRIGAESPLPVHLESTSTNATWLGVRMAFEVEVRRVGEPFTGVPTARSPSGTAGEAFRVTLSGLPAGAYRWRARSVWPDGIGFGRWVDFGDNDRAETDFRIAPWPITPTNLGSPCTVNSECSTGFCRDGSCCSTSCDGVCQRCAAGTGRCTALEGDPDNECDGVCRTGECSRGGGSCQLSDPGTPCGLCLACDSEGECVVPVTTGECGPDMGMVEPHDMGSPELDMADDPPMEPVPDMPADDESPTPTISKPLDPFACDCDLGGGPPRSPFWLLLGTAFVFVKSRRSRTR